MESKEFRKERQKSKTKQIKKEVEKKLQEYLHKLKYCKKHKVTKQQLLDIKQNQKQTNKKKKRRKMDQIKPPQPGIVVGYHYPCIDGIYSMMNCFLSLKLYNQFNKDLLDRLLNQDLQNDYFNKTKNEGNHNSKAELEKNIQNVQEEQKQSDSAAGDSENIQQLKSRITLHSDDLKGYAYSDSFRMLKYVPCRIQQDPSLQIDSFKFKQVDVANSVVILLDYYGQSAANLKYLCEHYKRVIVIDHHITIESTFTELIKENSDSEKPIDIIKDNIQGQDDQTEENKENQAEKKKEQDSKFIPKNILSAIQKIYPNLVVIYNSRMSGATLTLDFFTKLFDFDFYLNEKVYNQVCELSKLVEIYDTKFEKSRRAEAFVANIISQQFNLNPKKNQIIFSKLISCYIEGNVKLGERILDAQEKVVNSLVKQKFIVHVGGKHNTLAKCYAVMSTNFSVINQTAHKLAEMSLQEGMDNMGCFIINEKGKGSIKVSIRADNDPAKERKCHLVAKHFGGGGHPTASSFFTTFTQIKSWR